jgi:hypothetical protein
VGLYAIRGNRKEGKNHGAGAGGLPVVIFALFLVSAAGARENHELTLANLHYDRDDYAGAYTRFQNAILWGDGEISGDTFYRYAYSREQLRGPDDTALQIYALALYRFGKEGRADSRYARYAAAKLGNDSGDLDDAAAAALLEELRAGINGERKVLFHRRLDRVYGFLSRFSLFQWKIIASLAAVVPFLTGIVVLALKGRAQARVKE